MFSGKNVKDCGQAPREVILCRTIIGR